MINVGDVGTDYEHGLQLLKKLNEFRGAGSGVSFTSQDRMLMMMTKEKVALSSPLAVMFIDAASRLHCFNQSAVVSLKRCHS